MKNCLRLILLSLLISQGLLAQISVGIDQVPIIGDTLEYSNTIQTDGLLPGNAGANQVWDFSTVTGVQGQTEIYIDPSSDTTGLFPTATLGITGLQGTNIQYAEVTNDEVLGLGLASADFMGFNVVFALDPPQTIFKIPMDYGQSFIDDYGFVLGLSDPQPNVDTARVISTGIDTVTADAYGVLRLPQGDFEVLRLETKSSVETSVEIFLGFFWLPVLSDTVYTTNYSFVARESKRELARMQLDSAGTGVGSFAWQDNIVPIPPDVPVAAFDYEANPSQLGQIDFTDLSMNAPVEFAWDFGDGNTSQDQHPTHVYTTTQDYTVCLIVSNSSGSDMTCQTISVNATPPVPEANFTYMDTSSIPGLVDFEDLSLHNPTSWLWNFGDGITSTDQHPTHTFASDNTYNVCLTATNDSGSDSHCESLFVNVGNDILHWNPNWIIAPNPSDGKFTVSFQDLDIHQMELLIYDSSGKLLINRSMSSSMDIDLTENGAGSFLISLKKQNQILGSTWLQVLK